MIRSIMKSRIFKEVLPNVRRMYLSLGLVKNPDIPALQDKIEALDLNKYPSLTPDYQVILRKIYTNVIVTNAIKMIIDKDATKLLPQDIYSLYHLLSSGLAFKGYLNRFAKDCLQEHIVAIEQDTTKYKDALHDLLPESVFSMAIEILMGIATTTADDIRNWVKKPMDIPEKLYMLMLDNQMCEKLFRDNPCWPLISSDRFYELRVQRADTAKHAAYALAQAGLQLDLIQYIVSYQAMMPEMTQEVCVGYEICRRQNLISYQGDEGIEDKRGAMLIAFASNINEDKIDEHPQAIKRTHSHNDAYIEPKNKRRR